MARISFPERGFGEHVDWALMRTDMAVGMGALSEAVYGNTQLALREREAARWTIALINHCEVCQDTRARDAETNGVDEGFYADVARWATTDALSEREKLAAEFAQRFALDHLAMDDAFWSRL
jgi:alkylhydroperoxidase family enzyme